jgi:polysaccharide export outer membrane protein
MIQQLRKIPGHWVVALGMILAGLLGGCQTAPKYSDLPPEQVAQFHISDPVNVSFTSFVTDEPGLQPFVGRIQGDGTITLPLIGSVTAVGKTEGELQKQIHDLYVPKYYQNLTVTVKGEVTYFYVDGEVQQRGQKEYPGQMTIVKAIAAAGGFTDFAKETKVRLTRGKHTEIINVKKAIRDPRYDVPVYPGDNIVVPRRILW